MGWPDIVPADGPVLLPAVKTAGFPGVPTVGNDVLLDGFDAAEDGQELVTERSRNNLYRTLHAVLKRAGIEPFARCNQVLRQCCETERSERLPRHVVPTWLGHGKRVSGCIPFWVACPRLRGHASTASKRMATQAWPWHPNCHQFWTAPRVLAKHYLIIPAEIWDTRIACGAFAGPSYDPRPSLGQCELLGI